MTDFFRFHIQYRTARVIMYFGLFIMPSGRYKTELLKVLYELKQRVTDEVNKNALR
jgi:hypothetical protein